MTRLVFWLSYALTTRLKQDAALLAAIRRRRSQAARRGSQAPFLDVGLNEDEAHLAKVNVNSTRAVCADGWKEVLRFEIVGNFVQFLPVPGEEDAARSWPIANANHITLNIFRAVGDPVEWLIVPPLPVREIS